MAQLRQDYAQFERRGAVVIVVSPEDTAPLRDFWAKENLPMIGLADPDHSAANRYGQEVSLLKLGRVPALMVIDASGIVRFQHYSANMKDIPENRNVLAMLDKLNAAVTDASATAKVE
jgi:peroxiredoxin